MQKCWPPHKKGIVPTTLPPSSWCVLVRKAYLAKAEKIHQPNKASCLITTNTPCAIHLIYFLPTKLHVVSKNKDREDGKKLNFVSYSY